MPVTLSPTLSSSESGSALNGQMVPLNCFLTGALRRERRDQDDGLEMCPHLQGTNIDGGRGQCKVKICRLEMSTSQHFPTSPANLYLPGPSQPTQHETPLQVRWLLFLCYFDPYLDTSAMLAGYEYWSSKEPNPNPLWWSPDFPLAGINEPKCCVFY